MAKEVRRHKLSEVLVCNSLDEVRANIDKIDQEIIALLAKRGGYVKQAARFKKAQTDVRAPQWVEQVIAKIKGLASEAVASPEVAEAVYRAMISAFIEAELSEHAALANEA